LGRFWNHDIGRKVTYFKVIDRAGFTTSLSYIVKIEVEELEFVQLSTNETHSFFHYS